jgi:long-subunit acyl-CoA synthetase (AMP-forming)
MTFNTENRPQTLPGAFQATAARVPDRVALRTPANGVTLTWAQYAVEVEATAGALAGLGVDRGDRVAFLSRNRPELAVAEVAALHLGAAGVALYTASPLATIEHVLRDSSPRALVIEESLLGILDDVLHEVPHVVAIDGPEPLGSRPAPATFSFEAAWRTVNPDDLLAILYTSGTTGTSKGVEWEHGSMMRALARFDRRHYEPDGISDISFASFAHISERAAGHWRSLVRGSTRTFCADPAALGEALLDARPTFIFAPPRVWHGLKRKLEASLNERERDTLTRAVARVGGLAAAEAPPPLAEDDQGVLAGMRSRIGLDRVNRGTVAAAPCPTSVQAIFHALGVPFGEFYAMTETMAVTMPTLGVSDLGTTGAVLDGYEVRLDGDGEILVQADSCARGYRNRPHETAETFTTDGFIRTGDIGEIDSRGCLQIVDRKKELLITDGGHNCAPAPIESELASACQLIGQICVVGEGRPHLAALIVLDPPARAADEEARAAVAAAIKQVNSNLDPRRRIEAHVLLPDPWTPGEELTETMKLRRRRIAEKYAKQIAGLYAEAGSSQMDETPQDVRRLADVR